MNASPLSTVTSELRDQLQRTLGDSYILERELGGGGMSRVFVAEETALGRKVVVKVLLPELAATVNIERFRREIQLAAKLQHPHIVPVLAAGVSEGLPYYTMPFIEGESLRARLAREGALPVPDTTRILRDVLSALAYAHEHGIVHRDMKPDNVLLTRHHAVVTDFGVAKALSAAANPGSSLTSLGVALGTPAYMSPEQAAADPSTDHRADLYGVGAMAYEMLTGQQVFSTRSPQAMLAAHVTETPEPLERRRPSVPPELASVVMRSLEKHAADRPQSAAEMLADVEAAVTPSGPTTPHTATRLRPEKSSDRRGSLMAIGATMLLLGMASSTAYWYTHRTASSLTFAAGSIRSLAVLPFENLGNAEDAYFADGMTEEITSRLGGISGLRLIGRQSVRGYANSNKPLSQIGKELGVTYILTGSVRWDRSQAGRNLVRVSPALLQVSDGTQIWSEPYEDQLTGVFQMQSKVAEKVAQALKLQLTGGQHKAMAARPTENLQAYDYYLRAKAMHGLRPAERMQVVALLEQATKLDPKFALAFAALGQAHTEAYWFKADPSQKRLQLAKKAIDSALALDPRLPEAYHSLGTHYYHGSLDYARALDAYRIAERLDPNNAEVVAWKALVARRQGQWGEAVAGQRRAAMLDPRNSNYLAELAISLGTIRDYDAADSVVTLILRIEPGSVRAHQARSWLPLLRSGDVQASLAALREAAKKVSKEEIDASFLFFGWPASEDPALTAIMEATPVPTNPTEKLMFFAGKVTTALVRKDAALARAMADSILSLQRVVLKGDKFDADFRPAFATAYAVRGEKSKAMTEIQKGMDAYPFSRDAVRAADMLGALGYVATLVGDNDKAISACQKLLTVPALVSRASLRVDPILEPLRKDPRFQALIAEN